MNSVGTPMDPALIPDRTVKLGDKTLRRIVNLHLVTHRGAEEWQIKQCFGDVSNGGLVKVELPSWSLPRKGCTGALIEMFKSEGRYAKVMNVFDEGVISKTW